MKKYLILSLAALITIPVAAVKRGPSIGSGYNPPVKVGPSPSIASANLATSQFQTNLSHVDSNQNGTKIISKPGQYYVSGDIQFNPIKNPTSSTIYHITTSNVVLDLNGGMISQGSSNTTLDMVGVKIDPNVHHVTIRNGTIHHLSGVGISIGSGSSNIKLQNLHITDCVQGSVLGSGTEESPIKSLEMFNLFLSHNTGDPSVYGDDTNTYDAQGAKLSYVEHFTIDSCGFSNNQTTNNDQAYGLYLEHCVGGSISSCNFALNKSTDEAYGLFAQQCQALEIYGSKFVGNNSSDEEGYGLALRGSSNNRVYRCEALGNEGKNDVFGFWAQGFTTTVVVGEVPITTYYGSHHNSFVECESIENKASSGNAYGFYSAGSTSNAFIHSLSQGNQSGTSASTIAAGIYVTELTLSSTTYKETLFSIDHCYIKGNYAQNGMGAGIIIAQCENGHVDSNWVLNNTGSTSSYGIIDQSTDSSTLIMNNYAYGHTKNYSANYSESNADIPVASASIGDFRPLNVATAFSNLEWRETPNETINS